MLKTNWGLIAVAVMITASSLTARAETLYGVSTSATGDFLVSFNSTDPSTVTFIDPITGLETGQSIVDMSFNSVINETFALGAIAGDKDGNLYELNLFDGVATVIDPSMLFPVTESNTTTFSSPGTGIQYLASTTKSGTELYEVSPDPSLKPLGTFANGAEKLKAVTAIPEPGVIAMLLIGAIGMVGYLRVRRPVTDAAAA